jgi:hypothetical protein
MANRYKVVGVNDDKDFCECCGRQGLKRVVWIEDTETQEIKHFGTTCAAAPVKGFGVDKEIKKAIRDFQDREQAVFRYAYSLYRKAGGDMEGNAQTGWTFTDKTLHANCLTQAREYFKK